MIKLFRVLFISLLFSAHVYALEEQKTASSFYKKLERHYLSSLAWQDEEWPNESYYEYLMRCMRFQKNPQEFKRVRSAFKIVMTSKQESPSRVLEDPTTWSDLCLFKGQHEESASLLSIIDRTQTSLGRVSLAVMLAEPLADRSQLIQRQQIIKELVADPDLMNALDAALKEFAAHENLVMSFWGQDQLQQAAERHYFRYSFLGKHNAILNGNVLALDVRTGFENMRRTFWWMSTIVAAGVLPVCGLAKLAHMPIPSTMIDFSKDLGGSGGPMFALIAKAPYAAVQGLATTVAGIYCALAVQEDYEWARDNMLLDKLLQEKLMACAKAVQAFKKLEKIITTTNAFKNGILHVQELSDFLYERSAQSEQLSRLFELLRTTTFKGNPSEFSRYGRILIGYSLMHETKDEWTQTLAIMGQIDAYLAVAKLYKEFESKSQRYCFAEFKESQKPSIELYDFWNPFLKSNKNIVVNSIKLGMGALHKDIIVTGPNAGGKSTVLRAIALNLILAQSFGIAPASRAVITPCSFIGTYLNITDDIDAGKSLFKSEVLRAQSIIQKLTSLSPHDFSFIIVDEMFSGTSPKEGQAAAYSVAKHLSTFGNNICIIATHYSLLTDLELQGRFANYKVSVDIKPDGKIHYPFTLEPGVSNQHIALDILRADGFAGTILDDAYALVKQD